MYRRLSAAVCVAALSAPCGSARADECTEAYLLRGGALYSAAELRAADSELRKPRPSPMCDGYVVHRARVEQDIREREALKVQVVEAQADTAKAVVAATQAARKLDACTSTLAACEVSARTPPPPVMVERGWEFYEHPLFVAVVSAATTAAIILLSQHLAGR